MKVSHQPVSYKLFSSQKLKDIKTPENASQGRKIFGAALWLVATARNAILVLFSSLAAYYAHQHDQMPFILTGKVRPGLPSFGLPPFETSYTSQNGTTVEMGFTDMISELGSSIALVPIIAVLGNVAISKAFGGSGVDATKELVALSMSNVIGSFFSSIPVTGSFSRSAVNHASGVRTPIGGIYTGALVLLALGILTPYFQFIPRAALSAVIISAVIFMIEYEVVKPLWRCSKRELLTVSLTLILSLCVGVEVGLISGVFLDVAFVVSSSIKVFAMTLNKRIKYLQIQRTARPVLTFDQCSSQSGIEYMLVRPRHSLLCFPAVEYVRNGINKAISVHEKVTHFIVVDCRNVQELDYTAAKCLGSLKKELAAKNILMILLGPPDEVKLVLKGSLKGSNVQQVDTEHELDICLQEQSGKNELQEVVAPLLSQPDGEQDIAVAKPGSLRKD